MNDFNIYLAISVFISLVLSIILPVSYFELLTCFVSISILSEICGNKK